jgi:dynein heavy chain
LTAGDSFLDIALGALELVNRKELGELAVAVKPPEGVEDILSAVIVLLAGKCPAITVQKSGRVKEKDRSWQVARTTVLSNINALIEHLLAFKTAIDEGSVHKVSHSRLSDIRF